MRKTIRCGLFLLVLTAAARGAPQKKDADSAPPKAQGVSTAPLTIELFSDYQCPSCATLFQEAIQPLIADYVRTGKVYLIHRDFPLPAHPYARKAACYATAAARISRFEQVCGALFEKQSVWSASGDIDKVLTWVLTPVELQRVRQAANDPQTAAAVQRDVDLGVQAGITQTPTLVLTRRLRRYPVSGAVSYTVLRRFIDQLLSQ